MNRNINTQVPGTFMAPLRPLTYPRLTVSAPCQHAELRIEFDACLHYAREAHGFFNRIFRATGLLTM